MNFQTNFFQQQPQQQSNNIFGNQQQPQSNTLFNNGQQSQQQNTFQLQNTGQFGGVQQVNQKEDKDLKEIQQVLENFKNYKRYLDLYKYVLIYQQGDQLERLSMLEENLKTVQDGQQNPAKIDYKNFNAFKDKLQSIRSKNEKFQRMMLDLQASMEVLSFKYGHIDRNGHEENKVHQKMKESSTIINECQNVLHDVNMKMSDYQNRIEYNDFQNIGELNAQQKKYVQEQIENIYDYLKVMKEAIQQLKIKFDQDEYDMQVLGKEFLNINEN